MNKFLIAIAAACSLCAEPAQGPKRGWLFLEGGSYPLDPSIAQAFVKLAGGPEKRFVLIPTAADENRIDPSKLDEYISAFGTKNFQVLHTRDRALANSGEFVKAIREASGVWMGGGKPQNLFAAYSGTLVMKELQALLDRGGVLGGSSAGAMIQPSLMIVGNKRRDTHPEYLPAFGFLRNAITLVHVEQRHTDEDLLDVARDHPELLCIGIDTATAIEVQGDSFQVVGLKRVMVVNHGQITTLKNGTHFNMKRMAKEEPIAVAPNVPVSKDRPDLFHGELWAAADPTNAQNLTAVSMAYDATSAKDHSVAYVSGDGGQSWKLALETGESVDPFCAYAPDGTLYFLHLSRVGRGMEIYHSKGGGATWSAPVSAPYFDRPYLTVSRSGRMFINAHEPGPADPRTRVFSLVTSSNGTEFGPAITPVGTPALGVTPGNGVMLSNGVFVAAFVNLNNASGWVGVVMSKDGNQLSEPVRVADWYNRQGTGYLSNMPQLAVDRSDGPFEDRLYVVWPDTRSGRSEIYLSWSADMGGTWSAPRAINDDAVRERAAGPDHLQPAVAVNNKGVVGVSWYDRRDDPTNRGWRSRFTASLDGGQAFLPSVAVSEAAYDPAKTRPQSLNEIVEKTARNGGAVSHRARWNFAFTGGDTAGISADAAGAFHVFWTDNRTGVLQVWTSTVAVH